MKLMTLFLMMAVFIQPILGQSDDKLRQSADAKMAPRSLLLSGGPLDSVRGIYVIEFPHPNECLTIPPIKASSRSMALYRAVSKGGFTLLPSDAGLTVWTIEEWEDLTHAEWYAKFAKQREGHCATNVKR